MEPSVAIKVCQKLLPWTNGIRGQILPGQMSSVKDGPRNLPLKCGRDRVSNSQDIPDIWINVARTNVV